MLTRSFVIICSNSPSIQHNRQIKRVDGKRWHLSHHHSLFNTTFSPKFELRCKHSRLVQNRTALDMETNEAFPAREKNPADFTKLEEKNTKMVLMIWILLLLNDTASTKWSGQINARPSKWGLGNVQINSIPGVLGWPIIWDLRAVSRVRKNGGESFKNRAREALECYT